MVSKLDKCNTRISPSINNSMFLGDAPGPIPRKILLERFRLADALKGRPLNIFDQFIDSLENLFISSEPILIIFPSLRGKDKVHESESNIFGDNIAIF